VGVAERVSEFVGLAYEAPYDSAAWDRMAHRLMELTHSSGLLISAVDAAGKSYDFARLYGGENGAFSDGLLEYTGGMFTEDPSLRYAAENPCAGFCDSERVVGSDGYRDDPFIRWNREHFGSWNWIVGYTPPQAGLTFGVSLHTPASVGHMEPEDEQLFRLVCPHIARAVRLAIRPPKLSDDRVALVTVNLSGAVVDRNERARTIIEAGDALTIEDGKLMPIDGRARQHFMRVLRDPLAPEVVRSTQGALRIPKANGRDSLLLAIEPLPRLPTAVAALQAAAIVRIVDPREHRKAGAIHATLFGLTERELEIADLLLSGHSPESIGNVLEISPATVRVHLRSLFRKTDTARQSELVDLLVRVS
jgi:DNA-binding CsgD family transcriptional regulator